MGEPVAIAEPDENVLEDRRDHQARALREEERPLDVVVASLAPRAEQRLRVVVPGDRADQRRLARAARSHQRRHAERRHLEIDRAQYDVVAESNAIAAKREDPHRKSSLPEDGYLELHVERIGGGRLSPYLCDRLRPGDEVQILGPFGECYYEPRDLDQPLLLVATGTGLAPLLGVARDAVARGHRGTIALFHGARSRDELYLHGELAPMVQYVGCVSGPTAATDVAHGRAVDVALARHPELAGYGVFIAGAPEAVEETRCRAIAAGCDRRDVRVDAFTPTQPYQPDDRAKLARIEPDPALWQALDHGRLLRAILEAFYARVYVDPRLAPFFQRTSITRAVDKQYEFLAWLISGEGGYFGLNPFNAHHWMVISDELFDYREQLLEATMRAHGLDEASVRRWAALHERFRREIVKQAPRGLVRDGVEMPAEGYSEETVDVATICDGCAEPMDVGSLGRLHVRTGELFCGRCAARRATVPPPA